MEEMFFDTIQDEFLYWKLMAKNYERQVDALNQSFNEWLTRLQNLISGHAKEIEANSKEIEEKAKEIEEKEKEIWTLKQDIEDQRVFLDDQINELEQENEELSRDNTICTETLACYKILFNDCFMNYAKLICVDEEIEVLREELRLSELDPEAYENASDASSDLDTQSNRTFTVEGNSTETVTEKNEANSNERIAANSTETVAESLPTSEQNLIPSCKPAKKFKFSKLFAWCS